MVLSYVSRDELLSFRSAIPDIQAQIRAAQSRAAENSTFLSYNSKDADLLPGIIRVLENHGASVYIDQIDQSLPEVASRKTAAILRDRIRACKKFVSLASENSKGSKWVPWELGLADGYRTPRNVAIFPAVESRTDTAWTEREYLGIYDRIVWGDINPTHKDPLWIVYNHEANTAVTLAEWLRS